MSLPRRRAGATIAATMRIRPRRTGRRERELARADELRASRARLVAASQLARRRVERDLHDGAQARLVLAHLKLALLRDAIEPGSSADALLQDVAADVRDALEELRDLARGIYPSVLELDGLPGALADLVRRSPLPARLDAADIGRHPRELEIEVYFCCSEALQNAAKHAGAGATVVVRLAVEEDELRFEVADDGRGCDLVTGARSAGLQNMADRVGALGGHLRLASQPGGGTRVAGSVPLARAA
jgi:signal transduction histidine kinase